MTYVVALAGDQHFEYTPGLIRSLHFMMAEHDLDAGPGLWRPGAIWIRNDATDQIVYEAPDSDLVPDLVDELVEQLSSARGVHPMIRAAMAHLNLVMIHPFRDGNGRMARCIQTLVLTRDGIVVPEFCSVEEYLGANTEGYYGVLGQVGQRSLASRQRCTTVGALLLDRALHPGDQRSAAHPRVGADLGRAGRTGAETPTW